MNIGIDMMGGDFAPIEAIKGIKQFLEGNHEEAIHLTLFGDEDLVFELLRRYKVPEEKRITVIPSIQVIEMNEHPTKALKSKPLSSIAVGFGYLGKGKIDAFLSAGNTGAMLVGAMFSIKAVEGVLRPTISSIIPKRDGTTALLLDVGLNSDCKPENLNQFATMGSVFAENMLGVPKPKVALLNVGEEESKGNMLVQSAHPLLKKNKSINFTGNIEGRDVFTGKADVMVCDGFTGNILLKLAESFYDIKTKENIDNQYLDRFNFELYGGTPVLGVEKPVIIGHGISKANAFTSMIETAVKMVNTDVLGKVKKAIQVAG